MYFGGPRLTAGRRKNQQFEPHQMTRLPPATHRSRQVAQRTAVAAALMAGALLVWHSALMWPGTVAAVDGATPSPWTDATETPTPDPAPTPELPATPDPTAQPTLEATPGPGPEPSPEPSAGGALAVVRYTFAHVPDPELAPSYLDPDTPLLDEPRFEVLRLRFEVLNPTADDIALTPLLEFAPVPGDGFAVVPEGIQTDIPFHAAHEWVAAADGGTTIGPTLVTEPIGSSTPDAAHSMGVNPMPPLTVRPGGSVTIEFSISATAAAAYDAEYALALTDAGAPLAAPSLPVVRMESRPLLELSPGQRNGAPATPAVLPTGPRFALDQPSSAVHNPSFTLSGETCAACHRAHTAVGTAITGAPTQLALCSSCHNGTALPSVADAYASPIPPNQATSRAYYQHDPSLEQGALGTANACADCHNPHDINSDPGVETDAGWTPSGRTYGATDSSDQRIDLEYRLCFKCHASPATLPSNADQPPSRYALDKAVEVDPGNASYHPIEAAGTNASTAMANSLLGTSPYKLWSFTPASTIRCVSCHADARIAEAAIANDETVPADADLPVHASPERGILIAPYQDRVLNGPIEPYQAADFGLCYVCHSEAPFVDESGDVRGPPDTPLDSNFRYHGFHLSHNLQGHGATALGLDIDTAEAGVGPAICAECHFRIHSTAFAVGDQTSNMRLVNFAPNVTALDSGAFGWQPRVYDGDGNLVSLGSCTLKCHGEPHSAVEY
jgi:predicted CXXCH cytochrome family protein